MTICVVVADDQALVRSGFRMILESEPDLRVVGEAANGREAVELARSLAPDIVLMDVRMPVMDGIAATCAIAALDASPADGPPRVIVLTTFDLDEYVFDALRGGASGFLLKDVQRHDLVHAVRVVAAGDALLSPTITRRLIDDYARRPDPGVRSGDLDRLTPRELETLRLVARGLSNSEIAAEFVVSEATVKTHVGHVFTKLGLRDRVQAVIAAYELGLVTPGDAG
jgi:DNA-binding NarL/FixJ family response regulator